MQKLCVGTDSFARIPPGVPRAGSTATVPEPARRDTRVIPGAK
jgi:hypothetical protein